MSKKHLLPKNGLSKQLLASFSLSLLLTGLVTLGINHLIVQRDLEKEKLDQAESIARSLEFATEGSLELGNTSVAERIVQNYGTLPAVIEVAIISPTGKTLANSSAPEARQLYGTIHPELQTIMDRVVQSGVDAHHRTIINGKSALIHIMPFSSTLFGESGRRGLAIVVLDLQQMHKDVQHILITSTAVMLIGNLAILALMWWRLQRLALSPLKRLNLSVATSKDAGEFCLPTALPDNEINFLATTFDTVFQQRQQAERALDERAEQLRKQNKMLSCLAKHQTIKNGNLQAVVNEMTQVTTRLLNVERASVWLYNRDKTHLQCLDLFEQTPNRHSKGISLVVADYPTYFTAINTEENLVSASNAHTDPRTCEFLATYLTPLNIHSLLDAPIRLGGQTVGVLCIEQVAACRIWSPEDESFARSIADLITLAIEARDRRRAAEVLAESENRFRTLVANIPGVVYRCKCDANWTMEFISEAITEISGYSASDFLGNCVRTFASIIHPDDANPVETIILQAIEQKIPYILEYRIVGADGSIRWVYEKGQGIFGENGDLLCLDGAIFDISERKQAEVALRESETQYQQILDAITDMVLVKGSKSRILWANRSFREYYGMTNQQLRDLVDASFNDPDYTLQYVRDDAYVFNTGETLEIEEPVTRHDGVVRLFNTIKSAIRNEEGQIVRTVGVSRDISDRKQAEEILRQSEQQLKQKAQDLEQTLQELQRTQSQLIQSEKMSGLGQMVAGVAHEINNPVNFIYGNISHINEYAFTLLHLLSLYQQHYPYPKPEIQAEIEETDLDFLMADLPKLLSSMKVGADRIREIVKSLRTFSRLDEAEFKRVDLHEGIDSTLMILRNRLKAKSEHPEIQIIKSYGNLPQIDCYPGQLNQVFMNLLTNAIDALDEYNQSRNLDEIKANPSFIRIETELNKNQSVVIRIADNGSGMNEKVQSKLFDPFFTTKPVGKGTGLGLAISYEIIVEKHQGKLYCNSAPGQGAEFIIEIPIYQQSREVVPR